LRKGCASVINRVRAKALARELKKRRNTISGRRKPLTHFFEQGQTVAMVGMGRRPDEKSVVLVENGNYLGFGFFDNTENISNLEAARNFIKPSKDNRVVQNIVNSYLTNPKGVELVLFN
jgi:DNA polymerase-3 subunit epsilon